VDKTLLKEAFKPVISAHDAAMRSCSPWSVSFLSCFFPAIQPANPISGVSQPHSPLTIEILPLTNHRTSNIITRF